MLNAARAVLAFSAGLERGRFESDRKTQAAVLYELTVLGEAARRVSPEFQASHEEIRWREIKGLRNRLVHEYDRVDLDQLWRVLQKDAPDLIAKLEPLIPSEPE